MKKNIITILAGFILLVELIANTEQIPQTLERTEILLEGYTAEKMRDYGFFSTPEKAILQARLLEKERAFKKTLSDEPTDKMKEFFIGHWVLADEKGIAKIFYFDIFDDPYYKLRYRYGSERSSVYFSADKKIYIFYSIMGGYIQQLKIINDKIFVYYLGENEWILDSCHEGGDLAYIKKGQPNEYIN